MYFIDKKLWENSINEKNPPSSAEARLNTVRFKLFFCRNIPEILCLEEVVWFPTSPNWRLCTTSGIENEMHNLKFENTQDIKGSITRL